MDQKEIDKKLKEFTSYCRDNGLNVTYQRLAIYRTLLSADGHLRPEDIHQRIREHYPNISLGTIYKTLDVFREHNLIRRVNDIIQVSGYDMNPEPHHYMVCRKCKKLIEVPVKYVGEIKLDPMFDDLFKVDETTIFFRGLCSTCRGN